MIIFTTSEKLWAKQRYYILSLTFIAFHQTYDLPLKTAHLGSIFGKHMLNLSDSGRDDSAGAEASKSESPSTGRASIQAPWHPFTPKPTMGVALRGPGSCLSPVQVHRSFAPTAIPVKGVLPLLIQGIPSPGRQREPTKGDIDGKAWDKELPVPFWRSL